MTFRRCIILSVSVLLLLPAAWKIVQACGGGDFYDSYTNFFGNDVTDKPAFTPFYYDSFFKYYEGGDGYWPERQLPDANIAAWKSFTDNAVPEADLRAFVYKYSYQDLSNLYFHIEKGAALALSDSVRNNAFTRWFLQRKDLEALGYLMYAKQCEPHVVLNEWESADRDTAKMTRLSRNGQQLHKAAKQDFFRSRYAYQVLRLLFYAGNYRQTLDLYPKLVTVDSTHDIIAVRTLGLKAGALYRTGRKAEAAYLYSRIFDRSDEEKERAYLSYDWAVGQEEAPVLQQCRTAHERAVVHLMDGLHEYEQGLPQLQAAYAADPKVAGLDVLMTREINKLEQRYLDPVLLARRNLVNNDWHYAYQYYQPYAAGSAEAATAAEKTARLRTYLQQLNAFAQKVAAEGKAGGKAFWLLASSYLYFIGDDPAGSKKYLDLAAAAGMSPRERDLHDVFSALYVVRSAGRITPATEEALLPTLRSLDSRAAKDRASGRSYLGKPYSDLMSMVLATSYLQQGDTVKAIYTLARTWRNENGNFYVSDAFLDLPGSLLEHISIGRLQEVKAFIGKGGKTPFEQWLVSGTPYTRDVLLELEGTKHLRQHQFREAVAVLKGIGGGKATLPDPFLAHIRDEQDLVAADTAKWYTKQDFAERMAELEDQLKARPGDAQLMHTYANGLYSMTYYGKAHEAFTYYRSSTDELAYYNSPERKRLPHYLQEYYGALAAEAWYVKAAKQTTDAGLRAQCLFLAAKCWQKRKENPEPFFSYGDTKDYYLHSLKNPYFRQLTEGGRATGFFSQAHSSCGYLRDYVLQQK